MISRDHPSTATTPPPPFKAADYVHDGRPHLLLCASGSVATIKIPQILMSLSSLPISIRLVLTPSASRFLQSQSTEQPPLDSLARIQNVEAIYEDHDEWEFTSEITTSSWENNEGPKIRGWIRGDPILHIELRKWADMMVIAPLSANMLAKITGGMAEGLLCSVVRAWDTTGLVDGVREFPHAEGKVGCVLREKPRILVAPAMNTAMWRQPITARQIRVLEDEWGIKDNDEATSILEPVAEVEPGNERWIEVLRPMEKELACGDVGDGAMKDWRDIVRIIETRLGLAG